MSESSVGADARWAKAAERAEGLKDLGIGDAVRRYFLVNFPLTLVIGLGIGFVIAYLWPDLYGGFVRSGVSTGLFLGGLAIFVVGTVYGSKKISPKVQRRLGVDVTLSLTADEVKLVRRQVMGKAPVAVHELPVLRGVAVQIREGLAKQLLTSPGLVVIFLGQATSRGVSSVWDVLMIVLLLVIIVLYGFLARQYQQTGAFLRSTAS